MSASFTIYNAAKFEIEAGRAGPNEPHIGWLDLSITETDGTTHDITIHFDTVEGFAMATRLAHLEKAITSAKEDV